MLVCVKIWLQMKQTTFEWLPFDNVRQNWITYALFLFSVVCQWFDGSSIEDDLGTTYPLKVFVNIKTGHISSLAIGTLCDVYFIQQYFTSLVNSGGFWPLPTWPICESCWLVDVPCVYFCHSWTLSWQKQLSLPACHKPELLQDNAPFVKELNKSTLFFSQL